MRTLALTDIEIFPPRNGETIPIAAHLLGLAELGHVDLACLGFQPQRPLPANMNWFSVPAEPRRPELSKLWACLRGQMPAQHPADKLELFSQLAGRSYDLVYAVQSRVVDWARAAQSCLGSPAMMLNFCDSQVEIHRRAKQLSATSGFQVGFRISKWVRSLQLPAARRWERTVTELFQTVLVQSENDRAAVAESAGPALADRVIAAPNGVRDDLFDCEYEGHRSQRLLHLGGLAGERFQLILWFVRKVFRPLLETHPHATLHLVGDVSPKHRRILERCPNVICHGFVEVLRQHLEEATVSVAPMMMNFGVINKVAESMAAGLPVVGLGAFSGFSGFVSGKHAVEVHSAAEWIACLQHLLNAPPDLTRLSREGRELAREMQWSSTLEKVQQAALASVQSARAARRAA